MIKNLPANAGDIRDIDSIPGEGHGNPFQYSCLEKSHRQRSLAGYRPWCPKESDITEHSTTQSARDLSGAKG